jgi:hypothetical protein
MSIHLKSRPETSQTASIWWLNPAVAFGGPCMLAGLTAYFTDESAYVSHWHTPKYFDFTCFAMLIAVVAAFAFGCLLGAARRATQSAAQRDHWMEQVQWQSVRQVFRLSFLLTMIAYAVWFGIAIKNGLNLSIILEAMKGSSLDVTDLRHQYLTTLPGITTMTQFGIAVVVLGVPLGAALGWRAVRWQLGAVVILAMVRSLVNSERLAVIELVVPLLVSTIWLRPVQRRIYRTLIRIAPVLGGVFLYLFFGVAEYFRSWNGFYSRTESSFWSFIGLRLMGYYATALNNGALLWKVKAPLPTYEPLTTLNFLWHFPVIKTAIPYLLPQLRIDDSAFKDMLTTAANPEFNNPSGIFLPLTDFALAGGLLYWLLCGLLVGLLYSEFKRRTTAGIFLYPTVFIALIEASRILYWGDGRFVPSSFLLIFCVLFVFRTRGNRYAQLPLIAGEVAPARSA